MKSHLLILLLGCKRISCIARKNVYFHGGHDGDSVHRHHGDAGEYFGCGVLGAAYCEEECGGDFEDVGGEGGKFS